MPPFMDAADTPADLGRAPARARAPAVAAWLLAVAAMVFAMVMIGGVTRLTESGLSIVEWQPVSGVLPPWTDAAWHEAFAKYQAYPEYQKRNLGMTLAEFKAIYWIEYIHRLWGRLIGVAFALPLAIFWFRGWLGRDLKRRLIAIFVLGAAQGVLGWYMVQSGLVDEPSVSPYRLTAHLGLALAIYGGLFWTALDLLGRGTRGAVSAAPWGWPMAMLILVGATIAWGGFVAGLDAGLAYNTFPLMGGRIVPDGIGELSPAYRNLFENVATVQFLHRVLALTTVAVALLMRWRCRGALAGPERLAADCLVAAVLIQAGLGIATLLLAVPVALAAFHQAGAVAALTAALWLARESRPAKYCR